MTSRYLTAGNSPEELDKLIQSFEFENQHIVKLIEKENQVLEALENEISLKKDSISKLQESTSQLDEETKRAHRQFIQNRDNCESLRKTASVLFEHEVALMKKLNSLCITADQERVERVNILQHYKTIWTDYRAKYESFPLARKYLEKKQQLEASSSELQEARGRIQKLKQEIMSIKGTDVDIYDMKNFLVAVAKLKIETENNKIKISQIIAEKTRLENTIKEIHQRKKQEAEAEKARVLEEKRQQELAAEEELQKKKVEEKRLRDQAELAASQAIKTALPASHAPTPVRNQAHVTGTAADTTRHQFNQGSEGVRQQMAPAIPSNVTLQGTSARQGDQEQSTLAHMYDGDQSSSRPFPTQTPQAPPKRQERPQTPVIQAPPLTNYQTHINGNNTGLTKYPDMKKVAEKPVSNASQRIPVPSYMIQAPPSSANSTPNPQPYKGVVHNLTPRPQPTISRQNIQGRQPSVPTFKHPSQLEPPHSRVSPPRSIQQYSTNTGHMPTLTSSSQNQIRAQSEIVSAKIPTQYQQPSQHTTIDQLQPVPTTSSRQVPNTEMPSVCIPQTPNRPIKNNDHTPKTPENQLMTSSLPGTPVSGASPFDLEKHLERVRLLTKSPGGPEYTSRPMFGLNQETDRPSDTQPAAKEIEDSPFLQSFFPDGRGDRNLFQSSFSSPQLSEPAGKSLFGNPASPVMATGAEGGMSFNFGGGGGETTQAGGSMFSIFGGPGEITNNPGDNPSGGDFSFNFGSSSVTSPTVNNSSGFSLF